MQAELGINLIGLGRADEAIAAIEPVLQTWERHQIAPTPARADAAVALGRAWLAKGEPSQAQPYLAQANAYWQRADPESRWAGEAAYWLGEALRASGRHAESLEAFERARRILARSPFPSDARLVALVQR